MSQQVNVLRFEDPREVKILDVAVKAGEGALRTASITLRLEDIERDERLALPGGHRMAEATNPTGQKDKSVDGLSVRRSWPKQTLTITTLDGQEVARLGGVWKNPIKWNEVIGTFKLDATFRTAGTPQVLAKVLERTGGKCLISTEDKQRDLNIDGQGEAPAANGTHTPAGENAASAPAGDKPKTRGGRAARYTGPANGKGAEPAGATPDNPKAADEDAEDPPPPQRAGRGENVAAAARLDKTEAEALS